MTTFTRAARAEWRRLARTPFDLALLTLLPAVVLALMAGMISGGSLHALKVVVVDRDGGPTARAVRRAVRASPNLVLAATTPDIGAALSAVRREDAVAVLVIPHGIGDRRPGTQPVELFYTGQFLAAGSLASTGLELAVARALGDTVPGDNGLAGLPLTRRPVPGAAVRLLGNPTLSLEWYLGLLLGPGILHLVFAVTTIGSVGLLLEDGSFGAFARATPRVVPALAGRTLPHIVAGTAWMIAWMLWLTLARGYRIDGNMAALAAGMALMMVATAGVGLLLLVVLRNVATALSGAVIVTGSALAYSGASLPINDAPWYARLWSAVLPLTHYLRFQMDAVIGAAARPLLAEAGVLLLYPLVAAIAAALLVARARRAA